MLIDASFNRLTGKIIAAAIEVHRTLGPGLLESAYAQCLRRELAAQGVRFEAERTIPIVYKGIPLDANFRVDLIVEDLWSSRSRPSTPWPLFTARRRLRIWR
jgi:hypothetical protein